MAFYKIDEKISEFNWFFFYLKVLYFNLLLIDKINITNKIRSLYITYG